MKGSSVEESERLSVDRLVVSGSWPLRRPVIESFLALSVAPFLILSFP